MKAATTTLTAVAFLQITVRMMSQRLTHCGFISRQSAHRSAARKANGHTVSLATLPLAKQAFQGLDTGVSAGVPELSEG
jgi:hypothetical protein